VFGDPDTVGGRRTGPHKGVDILTPKGTSITPVDRGKVIQAGFDPQLGNFVRVQHSWGTTTYLHGSRLRVKIGDEVGVNTVLMSSGSTGASTGPHTEFRLQNSTGSYVDPAPLIKRFGGGLGPSYDETGDFFGGDEEEEPPEGPDDTGEFPTAGGASGSPISQILKAGGFFQYLKDLGPAGIQAVGPSSVRSRMGGAPGIYSNELEDYETDILSGALPMAQRSKIPSSGLFSKTPERGRALTDLLSGFQGFGDVSDIESEYQLPFFEPSLGGESRASRNILRAMGMNPDIGNPYTAFLEKNIQRQAPQALATRWMRGETTNQRQIAQDITDALQQGRAAPMSRADLISGLQRLETTEGLNEPQQSLAALLANDPAFGYELIRSSQNLPSRLEKASRQAYLQSQERFMNRAPELENQGMLEFVRKYLQ